MRKIKIAIITLLLILGILTTVYATSASVQFKGNKEVTAETEQTVTVEISNNTAIGVINGVISYNSNIKDVKINSGYNGWMVTYNEETGQFNALKAEGATSGEALQITYKLKENATQGSIILKDVELTTIAYETIKIDNKASITINKKVNIEKTSSVKGEETVQRNYTKGRKTSKCWKGIWYNNYNYSMLNSNYNNII